MTVEQTVKRVVLWASAFITVATALGFINRWFIVEPIVAAVAEERRARVVADDSMAERLVALTDKLSEIAERQAIFTGAATAVPGSPEWYRGQAYLRKNANRVIVR